jgi:hypothetical protein
MIEHGPEAKALIDVGREAFSPREEDLPRVRAALAAKLAVLPKAAGLFGAGAMSAAKMGGVAVIVVAALIGGGLALRRHPQVSETPPAAAAPPPVTSVAIAEPAAPPSAETPAAASPAETAKPRSTPSSRRLEQDSDTLDRELALMKRAQAALASGDPSSSLSLLDTHAATFPRGALSEEREVTRVLALCALGRTSDAKAAAKRFERAAPRSMHLARIHSSCAGTGP